MGLNKALDPVAFLKLVREYDLVSAAPFLNLIAATLPWFEVFCGLLLVLGIAVRGAALMLAAMLVPFTLLVLNRALEIHAAGTLAFCAIRFDCGCGAGEVFICRKLLENTLLAAAGVGLVFLRNHRLCLREELAGATPVRREPV
jgi:uncharacterized membrane protein YphA (DoxX/SURF4 family)